MRTAVPTETIAHKHLGNLSKVMQSHKLQILLKCCNDYGTFKL